MSKKTEVKGLTRSEVVAVIAIVFLIVGYQTAVFINKAALSAIAAKREAPDTVYVIDPVLAQRLLGEAASEHSGSRGIIDESGMPVGQGLPANSGRSFGGGFSGRETKTDASPVSGITIRKSGAVKAQVPAEAPRSAPSSGKASSDPFRFNPNTASVEELCRLGFSRRQAESIEAYRLKGGRFRRKSDFAKSYVVSDEMFSRLEPYIDIPLLDLNLADSAAFDALPGIGGYFASQMVQHRERLGGYSCPEQLLDIRKFDETKYEQVRDLVCVNPANTRPYPLWALPEDSLRLHPYISPRSAHGIVIFRENNPRENWTVDALLAAGVLDSSSAEKLRSCILSPP
ncbi:MAG: ComEA family DNA-binding protein [Candidatus Cryptobacteroides sp.]